VEPIASLAPIDPPLLDSPVSEESPECPEQS
jgi:hypothetical protein